MNAVEHEWKMTPLHFIAKYNSTHRGHEDWTDDDYLSNFNVHLWFFVHRVSYFSCD